MGKSLSESNIHLRDADKRQRAMARNVETSSAIEGIYLVRDAQSGRFVAKDKGEPATEATETSRSPR